MSAGKDIAGHGGNGTPPPTEQVVQLPITKQTTFNGVQVDAQPTPDGGRQLVIIDPGGGHVYLLPMAGDLAREIGRKLMSSVPVAGADEMPKSGTS